MRLSLRTEELQLTLVDLKSSRQRQDELRGYARLVTQVQEEERRRLARELHDDTAQALIALARGLDGLGQATENISLPQQDRAWLHNLQELADRTLEGVRRACRDLRPSVLDDLGLRDALEWLCDSYIQRGILCEFTCIGEDLPTFPEADIALYRIAQEALSNAWKHAQATSVHCDLTYQPERLVLRILDNGQGFILARSQENRGNSQGGLGLLGMRERAAIIGADLNITSAPGQGCTVLLCLPLPLA
jgi:signal transduction histidine kinase